ncbi:MAG: NAD(P)H-dependent glycerol-3-phosphate dehydrogenase, partial [Acholeplasmataceae bacterium]
MKIAIIGGGAWGATLAQVVIDNNHEALIYDVNEGLVQKINQEHRHPFFDVLLPKNLKATHNLSEVIAFQDIILLSVPTKFMRSVLKEINPLLKKPTIFIDASKGLEPETYKRMSDLVKEEINKDYLKGYVVLTGPSHAEEVILRKITLLTAASEVEEHARLVQEIFSNETYMRVYTSTDVIGCEVGGAAKNAIAVVSGMLTGAGMGENARAALITRGILEIARIVEFYGGNKETSFGLTGIGDLIVTASSQNSRNFRAGVKLGQG